MFKSQNGSTWSGEQNEDVKFKLNACSFTTDTFGNVNRTPKIESADRTQSLPTFQFRLHREEKSSIFQLLYIHFTEY